MTKHNIEVTKLVQIAVIFWGLLMISFSVTGTIANMRLMNFAEDLQVQREKPEISYYLGVCLWYYFMLIGVLIAIIIIRHNRSFVQWLKKFARETESLNKRSWQSGEIHAMICVFVGTIFLLNGITDISKELGTVINLAFVRGVLIFWLISDPMILIVTPFLVCAKILPGLLLVLFAKKITSISGKMIAK